MNDVGARILTDTLQTNFVTFVDESTETPSYLERYTVSAE